MTERVGFKVSSEKTPGSKVVTFRSLKSLMDAEIERGELGKKKTKNERKLVHICVQVTRLSSQRIFHKTQCVNNALCMGSALFKRRSS